MVSPEPLWRTSTISRESIGELLERRFLAHRARATWWLIPACFLYGSASRFALARMPTGPISGPLGASCSGAASGGCLEAFAPTRELLNGS